MNCAVGADHRLSAWVTTDGDVSSRSSASGGSAVTPDPIDSGALRHRR